METNWPHNQGFYNYYPQEHSRASERHSVSPNDGPLPPPSSDESNHRRAQTQPSNPNYLPPPPPPHSTSPQTQMLPPFHSSFYPGYHTPGHSQSSSAPSGIGMQYGNGPLPGSAPPNQYPYNVTSPINLPTNTLRGPPPHTYSESPRMPTSANWSSSPGLRHLSPTSPTTHLVLPAVGPSSVSTSSSSYPSVTRTPGNLPPTRKPTKRRSGSTSMSVESWDDDKYGGVGELGEETEDQPWGMPQDEYKALNPKDKKQVRNRIGARRFRAKRKNYVSTLEHSLRVRDDQLANLRSQLNAHHAEINDLRSQLGIAPLPPLPSAEADGALGLMVNHSGDWDDKESL